MLDNLRTAALRALRWSEKYTKTDMVYLASGGFWLTVELVFAAVISFCLAVVFGHYASKDIYGNYKYVLSTATVLSAFSLTGIGTAITRSVSQGNEGALKQGARMSWRWGMIVSAIALAVGIYYFWQGNRFVAVSMCVVAVASPFLYSFSLFDNFLIGRRDFSRSALYSMLSNLALIVALVAALFIGGRAIALVVAYFAVNTATAAYFYFRTIRKARNEATDPELFTYGFHLSVMGIIGTFADQIDSIATFAILGPANLAVYAYAIAIPEQVKGVIKNLTPLSLPKFAQRSLAEIKATIWRRSLYLCIAIVLVIVVYWCVAPWIFRIFFPVYTESLTFTRIYSLSILGGFVTPFAAALQSHQKTKQLYISSVLSSAVIIISFPILTYLDGLWGAIASQLLYRFSSTVLTLWQFWNTEEKEQSIS